MSKKKRMSYKLKRIFDSLPSREVEWEKRKYVERTYLDSYKTFELTKHSQSELQKERFRDMISEEKKWRRNDD